VGGPIRGLGEFDETFGVLGRANASYGVADLTCAGRSPVTVG
jgi:hypothetical protein